MFLGYSLKRKTYRCFNYRTKTIVECSNVSIDENFGTKEKMVDYNSNEEEDNYGIVRHNAKVFFETNNDLQNEGHKRQEQSSKPLDEPRIVITPNSGKNMIKNHPYEQIIGSKDKGMMTRSKVNEELCLISQVELKNVDEVCKDD